MELTAQEIGCFTALFNRQGYVLDFTTNDFDCFTLSSVGVSLCEKYKCSKGKALTAYINEADSEKVFQLISDLFEHYEKNFCMEYDEDADEYENYGHYHSFNPEYSKLYKKCKIIMNRCSGFSSHVTEATEELKVEFSSEYIDKHIEEMLRVKNENPTLAIGMAKEFIECCCKTVLDGINVSWSEKWDLPQLTKATLENLELLPDNIDENERGAGSIKAVLGNLRGIVSGLAEMRNSFGSGHGKKSTYKGLETRHAALAVGSSVTFVRFVWETYKSKKRSDL